MSEVFTIASSIADTGKEALDIAEAMSKAEGSASKSEFKGARFGWDAFRFEAR